MTNFTYCVLSFFLLIVSCKKDEVLSEGTLFEKQEKEQVDKLLSSNSSTFSSSQTERLEKLYQASMPMSNIEAVRQLDIYKQTLSAFRENPPSGWAILFLEIGKKDSKNSAEAGALLRDLALPKYQFILDELKASDVLATDLIFVQRLLKLDTFGGLIKDPSK
ncbi:hypothetical protein [Dyadobacter crusticola]|uniref:hypothetical protein n=1 Tax=Dyadobacter crusticola TaxID=292407 RepID=UPI0012F7B81B|nr:hypothetical protein [Dyadobacter crusticola]